MKVSELKTETGFYYFALELPFLGVGFVVFVIFAHVDKVDCWTLHEAFGLCILCHQIELVKLSSPFVRMLHTQLLPLVRHVLGSQDQPFL
jgi:hypothetical protein